MIEIISEEQVNGKKQIAILDTSTISFMLELQDKGVVSDFILQDYDLIIVPKWVLIELNDAEGRKKYLQELIEKGYPIYSISESDYTNLTNAEEGNLYQIVYASTSQLAHIKSYLRRFVEQADLLDMKEYREWMYKLYEEWPIPGEILSSGRVRKKNAGEVSITILGEIISWYYPNAEVITIYSQDSDVYEFQHQAELYLQNIFSSRLAVPISYKSNDAILCQLYRTGKITVEDVKIYRKDKRRITYSRKNPDQSIVLVKEVVDNERFMKLIQDQSLHIIF